jgi:hypothetical protein
MEAAFKRALQTIPPQLRERPGTRFTVIINGQKKPEGKDWSGPNGANYGINDPPLAGYLSEGHNYGVLCGHAGITIPDLDDLARLKELGIMERIPNTMQVKTGRGGKHVYLDCPGLDHQIGLYDPELKDEDGEPLHLGEIQSTGQQVVGPGSIHPNGNRYKVTNDVPILAISKADLLKIFDGLILTGIDDPTEEPRRSSERRRKAGGSSIGDSIPIDQVVWPKNIINRSGAEVIGSHPIHGSTTGKNFSVNTAKNCWHCFRCGPPGEHRGGGGPLEWLAVEAGLISCKDAKPGCLDDKVTFKKILQIAKDRGFSIPDQERPKSDEHKGPTVEEITQRIKADPRTLKDRVILAALAALKIDDPIEYDLLLAALKKENIGIKIATINELVDKCIQESKKATAETPDTPSDIVQAAKLIIDGGEAYEYIHKIWQKRVKGNEYLGKALLVSRGVQSCLNTKGVHVYAHGKHGHGKSEGMEKMIELVPPELRMDEDVSPLAIHYASKNGMLLPGTTLLIDEMVWNDSLGGIIKRVITRFQKGAGHLTVIDGESVLARTQPRLAIWTNSADLQADEQLRDRFLDEPITEGKNYVKDIIEFQKLRDTLPDSFEDVGRETSICQAILRDLAGKTFTVKIPFANRIKIEASEGTRGYNIFSDLVKGLAAMRYAKREVNEQGQLLATEVDFKDAKDIYEGSRGHSEESYTTAEITVLQAIIDHGYKALYRDIKNITGMSEGRIKDIVNGRGKDEQKRHGLRYKCSQLDVNTVDISTVIKGTYSDRVTTHPVELSLPAFFCLTDGLRQNLVSLDPDVERRIPDVDPDVVDIDISRDRDVVDVVKEEREEEDTSKSSIPFVDGSIPSSKQKPQKITSTTSPSSPIAKSTTSPSETPYVGYVDVAKEQATTVAVRFKTDYKTDLPGKPYEIVKEGTIADLPPERAEHYIKRGVAEAVAAA